jgi:aquaglyceroporin related protein
MSNLKVEEHKEHNEHLNGSATGSNSPQSLYFENPKLKEVPHAPAANVLAEHGPLVDGSRRPIDEVAARPDLWWAKTRATMIEPFSEFFGVFIMILFGDGVVGKWRDATVRILRAYD